MQTIALALVVFIRIIGRIIFIDIFLSLLTLFWIRIHIKFVKDVLRPIYDFIRGTVPSTFWGFDLAPIIVILILTFLEGGIYMVFPEVKVLFKSLTVF